MPETGPVVGSDGSVDVMILVVVRKVGWQKSPWDSFTRTFQTEPEFLDWWIAQSESCYMKRVGGVSVFRCETAGDLLVEWAPPPETPA